LVGHGAGYDVFVARWPVIGGVNGEGLLLTPKNDPPVANIVAIPDVRYVIVITISVEEQIGRLQHEGPVVSKRGPEHKFRPVMKSFCRSGLPSPFVSSKIAIRSAPLGPRGGGSALQSLMKIRCNSSQRRMT
jgi:hypothetical protein